MSGQLSLFEAAVAPAAAVPELDGRPLRARGNNRVEPISALSVKQPWAYALLELGKDVENRSWWTPYRGDLVIHAPKSRDHQAWRSIADIIGVEPGSELSELVADPRANIHGAYIGVVEVVDVVQGHHSRWAEREGGRVGGPWHWVLARPRWLCEPIPARGYQSLWMVAPEDLEEIERQLEVRR